MYPVLRELHLVESDESLEDKILALVDLLIQDEGRTHALTPLVRMYVPLTAITPYHRGRGGRWREGYDRRDEGGGGTASHALSPIWHRQGLAGEGCWDSADSAGCTSPMSSRRRMAHTVLCS
jgi:hypothetical protein